MKKVCSLLAVTAVAGCQQVPVDSEKAASFLPRYHVAAPVSIYSTYASEKLASECKTLNNDNPCEEDAISGNQFAETLTEKAWFDAVLTDSDNADYELLIASVAGKGDHPGDDGLSLHTATGGLWPEEEVPYYFTELTLQWRGVEIDTQQFRTVAMNAKSQAPLSEEILDTWWLSAIEKRIFSAEYLFAALGASNYRSDLVLPEQIGEFIQKDSQYYPDPFKGVITRYVHPEYEDALIDITVSPIMIDMSVPSDTRLQTALEINLQEARQIALVQKLDLVTDAPVEAFSIHAGTHVYQGFRLAVHAKNELAEPIFATTYVFEMKDKLVTLATTFPPRIANALVAEAIPLINVPGESELMKAIRGMAAKK